MLWLWVKSLHIIFMICWFAGLFYLPRLFVYHAMSSDSISLQRFNIMERKLFYGIMTPSAVLTILSGAWLISHNLNFYLSQPWMLIKLIGVLLLIIYHGYCGFYYHQFKNNNNHHSHKFYRYFNEAPVLMLFLIIVMVIIKPSL